MSDAIRDSERAQARQMDALKQRLGRDLKNIENAHSNHKADLKESHEGEIVEVQAKNHKAIALEAEKKEKVLEEIKDNLKTTQDLTEKQLKAVKVHATNEKNLHQQKLVEDREKITEENELHLMDVNERFQRQAQEVQYQGKAQVSKLNDNMNEQFVTQSAHHSKKLNDHKNNFAVKHQFETMEQKRIKDDTDNRFKTERFQTNQRQQVEMSKLTETQKTAVEARNQHFRKVLGEQDLFYEKKFSHNLQGHQKNLKNLDELHNTIVQDMKQGLTQKLDQASDRTNDDFYQFSDLKPSLSSFPDRVVIKVAVPDYAKQDLQLGLNFKEAIITFNRRYTDSASSPEGHKTMVNKVETLTSRIMTDAFLDPKSVKATYDNGVMTYVIKKA